MADMTHKHHNLIYDAIEAAVDRFINRTAFKMLIRNDRSSARALLTGVVNDLATEFSTRLRYTNDKFDAGVWSRQVQHIGNEAWKKIALPEKGNL